jgi:hypothetical protein
MEDDVIQGSGDSEENGKNGKRFSDVTLGVEKIRSAAGSRASSVLKRQKEEPDFLPGRR